MKDNDELADAIEALAEKPAAPPPPPALEEPKLHGPNDPRPAVGKLLNSVIDDAKVDFASWMLSGLGTLVSTILAFALIIGGYIGGFVVLFAFIIAGSVVAGEDGAAIGNLFGMLSWMVLMFGGIGLSGVVAAPITSSIGRAVLAHIRDGEPLTAAAGFSTVTQDLPKVIGTSLIGSALVIFGMCFFYIGALVASFFLHFTAAAVVVHRVSPFKAVSLSVRAALMEPGWHLGVWGLGILMFMIAGNIPFVGVMIATPLWWALTLRAYIAVYGDGDEPAELV